MTSIPADDGLHPGISDLAYHADHGSLSSSGARALISSCPAKFAYQRTQPPIIKRDYDFGHIAHALVLGEGSDMAVLDPAVHGLKKDGTVADSPRATGTWKTAESEARAAGKVPVHVDEYRKAEQMAAAVFAHPIAARLLGADGYSELSGYWTDPITGVRLRYRPDRLAQLRDGRIVCIDYKTTVDASPRHFAKDSADYGYFQQDPWYRDGLIANDISDDPLFVFIAQEKTAPHLVSVFQHVPDDVQRGRELNRAAVDLYAQCTATDNWPGYSEDIQTVTLPAWHAAQHEIRLEVLTNQLIAA